MSFFLVGVDMYLYFCMIEHEFQKGRLLKKNINERKCRDKKKRKNKKKKKSKTRKMFAIKIKKRKGFLKLKYKKKKRIAHLS